ncbi:hypothetical protein P389DRAFT_212989 [Cystobasidium minutum MCA 4210]|uniref:uncharacterized protein n=1 Tax=Cystobasidium minutum MCA 4210 TaxID=1397322 RepID=UPI0034CD1D17|eukprot:jgi/Rhomi1/212989/estExt_Genemark1.C_80216
MHTLPPINSPLLGGYEFGQQGPAPALSSSSSLVRGKRPLKSYATLALGLCFGSLLVWTLTAPETVARIQDNVTIHLSSSSSRKSYGKQSSVEKQCNPFNEPGQLEVKQGDPDANVWKPWNPSCNASSLLTNLRNREDLPWLHNKTVAIFGDSIDRDHIEYFCEMSRGNMEWIWEGSRYDPAYTYSPGDPKSYSAADNGQSTGGGDQSRPRICYLEEYDFAVVFAFHYGLSDGGEGERNLAHFYPPFRFQDRLKNILVPILKSAKRYPPTLVELGTGTWDLQHWTFEDREADVDRMSFVSSSRAEWYRERFATALATVEEVFAQENQEERVSLMFREMQFTKMVDSVPPPRVQGLKNLQSHIMKEKIDNGSWSIDPLARLILGQEHYYRDSIHPIQLPAGKIWADIMLHQVMMLSR